MRFNKDGNSFPNAGIWTNTPQPVGFERCMISVDQSIAFDMKMLPNPLRPIWKPTTAHSHLNRPCSGLRLLQRHNFITFCRAFQARAARRVTRESNIDNPGPRIILEQLWTKNLVPTIFGEEKKHPQRICNEEPCSQFLYPTAKDISGFQVHPNVPDSQIWFRVLQKNILWNAGWM